MSLDQGVLDADPAARWPRSSGGRRRSPRRPIQRVLIGTSSLRSSSSGACSDSASVTGMPSPASLSMRRDQPDRGHRDAARRHAEPVRRRVGQPADRADGGLVVGQRLAHAHEDHVADPQRATVLGAPPASSPRRSDRARRATTCSTISAADMLRVRPSWPVAQKGQFMPQPAWLDTQMVTRLGVAHQHALDQGAVVQPPDRLDRGARRRPVRCTGVISRVGSRSRHELVADRLGQVGHLLGRLDQPLEVVRRQLLGAEALLPQRLHGLLALGRVEVGEVPRRLAAARGGEGQLAGRGAAAWARGGSTGAAAGGGVGRQSSRPVSQPSGRKGQTRPAAPRRRGPRAAASRAGPSARRGPGRMLPMSLMPRSRLTVDSVRSPTVAPTAAASPDQRAGPPRAVQGERDRQRAADARRRRPSRRSPPRTSWG